MQDSLDFSIIEHGSRAYEQACLLRDEILRKPLGMSLFDEDLDAESGFIHVAGLDDTGATQAYLYLKPIDDKVVKMKQVVVAAHLQGRGIGRKLITVAEEYALQAGYREVILHAREVVMDFYVALGYLKEGDAFIEVSLPHYRFRKEL